MKDPTLQEDCPRIALRGKIKETCLRHGVQYLDVCESKFLNLSESYRNLAARPPASEITKNKLIRLRSAAGRLEKALRALEGELGELLPDFLCKEISVAPLVCATLQSAIAQVLGGREYENAAKELIAKKFIKVCMDFGIPISWGKEIDSCPESSAQLLGAIFAAGGMQAEGDVSPSHRANHYIAKLSKGFTCDADGLVVRVFFDRIELEPNPLVGEMVCAVLEGRDHMLPGVQIPQASCRGHDIGVSQSADYGDS